MISYSISVKFKGDYVGRKKSTEKTTLVVLLLNQQWAFVCI